MTGSHIAFYLLEGLYDRINICSATNAGVQFSGKTIYRREGPNGAKSQGKCLRLRFFVLRNMGFDTVKKCHDYLLNFKLVKSTCARGHVHILNVNKSQLDRGVPAIK